MDLIETIALCVLLIFPIGCTVWLVSWVVIMVLRDRAQRLEQLRAEERRVRWKEFGAK